MLTLTEILAIPDEALPMMLKASTGLPPGVAVPTCPAGVLWLKTSEGYETWEPHAKIAHAWSLVETWGLTIEPSRYPRRGRWWVGQQSLCGCFAATFPEVPAAICRAVLLLTSRQDRDATLLTKETHNVP